MKRTVLMATLGAFLAVGAISATGGAQAAAKVEQEKPKTADTAAQPAAKPAKKATTHRHAAAKGDQATGANAKSDLQVKAQPTGPEPAATVAPGELTLGTVKLPRSVKADGKPLAAGTYQVRLTGQEAESKAQGATPSYERWAEFIQGGQVKGREVVTIVPQSEASKVAKETPPSSGRAKVEMLKGDNYLRVWINKGGNQYLIHLVPA